MRTHPVALTMAAIAVAAVPLATATAEAGPARHTSPSVAVPTLRVVGYGAVQHPHSQTAYAAYPTSDGHCVGLVSDGDASAPGPFLVEPGTEKLRISLRTRSKPSHHSLDVYAEPLAKHPSQKPVRAASRLVPITNAAGHRVWQLRSTLQLGAGQAAYLSLALEWKKAGCHSTDSSSWTFHVEAAG